MLRGGAEMLDLHYHEELVLHLLLWSTIVSSAEDDWNR